jgi:hypothetical protein
MGEEGFVVACLHGRSVRVLLIMRSHISPARLCVLNLVRGQLCALWSTAALVHVSYAGCSGRRAPDESLVLNTPAVPPHEESCHARCQSP